MSTSAGVIPASANAFGPADRSRGRGHVGHRGDRVVRRATGRAAHVHGPVPEVACPFLGGHDDAAAAVGDHAAVELVQRVGDEPRRHHVVDGDRVAVHRRGLRVACSRVCTAIDASCSGLVPYSCMCRCAAIAYAPDEREPARELVASSAAATPCRARHRHHHRCRACGPTPTVGCCRRRSRSCRRRRSGWRGTRASRGTRSSTRRRSTTRASGASGRGTRPAPPRACRRSRRSRVPRCRPFRGRRRRAPAGTTAPRASRRSGRA